MKNKLSVALAGVVVLAGMFPNNMAAEPHLNQRNHIRHVLLISVDGLHALDVSNYISAHPNRTFPSRHHLLQCAHAR